MTDDVRPIAVAEYEDLAREVMEPGAWDYYAGGAGDEVSIVPAVAGGALRHDGRAPGRRGGARNHGFKRQ